MSYVNVRLTGGPADGKYVVVPLGVSLWNVAEMPDVAPYWMEKAGEPVDALVHVHSYAIGPADCSGRYYEGIWQG